MKENQQQQSADLKTMGLKVTVPRLKILDLFQKLSESHEAGKRHLSAEEVYKLLLEENSDIGLATVYRVLTQLKMQAFLCAVISTKGERPTSFRKVGTMTISFACVAAMLKNSLTRKLSGLSVRLQHERVTSSPIIHWCCTASAAIAARRNRKTTRSDEIGSLTLFSKGLSSGIAKLPAASSEQG